MERKIKNFISEILVNETFEKYGYYPDDFGQSSAKFILCRCRFCGEPVEIRKGFFNKASTACHKECRIQEQKLFGSPFNDPKVREKAKKTNLERYGVESANQNKEIAKKISEARKTQKCQNKIKQTNLEKYGVENVFQSEEIKEKIKQTNMEKYGAEHPQKSEEIRQKTIDTLRERYGVENMAHDEKMLKQRVQSFKKNIATDEYGSHKAINVLRNEAFWDYLEKNKPSLSKACEEFGVDYASIAVRLSWDEFKDKFKEIYTYPKHQTQNEIKSFIANLGFNVMCDDRTIISPMELDIYVPEKDFAIEYNGSYWHSEGVLDPKDAKNKHLKKLKACREKGIRLFQIFEHTWLERKKQILNFIRSILGKNKMKIGARKCSINNENAKQFIENNHIQGYGNRTIKFFNLISDNKIVASMTASKHHRQNIEGNPIVLNRLCFADDTNISGGASKLFRGFVDWAKNEKYDKILSWSDSCWTEGGIYKTLGFEMKKEHGPDYFYWHVKNGTYLSKQSCCKKKIGCPDNMTERDFCFQNKIFRIWDCGKKTWEYKL